nr:hypothetical protein [Ktedonobacterales bacterium]
DVGRALSRDGVAAALFGALQRRLAQLADPSVARAAGLAQRALDAVATDVRRAAGRPSEERQVLMRTLTRRLARAVTAALLVEDAGIQARADGGYRCLLQALRYLRREVYPPRWGGDEALDRTPLDLFDVLVDWVPALPASAAEPLLTALEAEV